MARASVQVRAVPGEGFEPSRPRGQRILNPPCLPFHHPGRIAAYRSVNASQAGRARPAAHVVCADAELVPE
jgi:hypothetical protein